MKAEEVLARADALFAAGRSGEAAAYMEQALSEAKAAGDWGLRLTLINELMGYYRATSRFDRAWAYVDEARRLLEEHGIARTLSGVTTVLNIANVYRAGGRPAEALKLYRQVEQVYREQELAADVRLGGLYNNMAVACLEQGERQQALAYAKAAAAAVDEAADAAGERATVYTNLASVLLKADPPAFDEAESLLSRALSLFENEASGDPHYGSALAARAYLAFRQGREDQAIDLYEQALTVTRRAFGENRDYRRLAADLQALRQRKEQRG